MQKRIVEGRIVIRGFITQTLDPIKTMQYGYPVRSNTRESLLDPEQLKEYVETHSTMAEGGFGVLYAFHGTIDGEPLSFDTSERARVPTLGYAVANVVGGKNAYFAASFNESEYQRPTYKYGEADFYPDIICAFKIDGIKEGSEVKHREWRSEDMRFFGNNEPATKVRFEPGHLSKAASILLPLDYDTKLSTKRRAGRAPDPDRLEKLPIEKIRTRVDIWCSSASEKLNGFTLKKGDSTRVYVLERFKDGKNSKVKIIMQANLVSIKYRGVDKETGDLIWKDYRDWFQEKNMDTDLIRNDFMAALEKLFAAFK